MCENVLWYGTEMIVGERRDATPKPQSDASKAADHIEARIPELPKGKEDVYPFPTIEDACKVQATMLGRLQRHGPRNEVRIRREGTSVIITRFDYPPPRKVRYEHNAS